MDGCIHRRGQCRGGDCAREQLGQARRYRLHSGDCGAHLVFCDQQRYEGVAPLFRDKVWKSIIARPTNAQDINGLVCLVADTRGRAPAPVEIDPEELAMIMYTSGTSGAKGAAHASGDLPGDMANMELAAAAAAMSNPEAIATMMQRGFEPTSLLAKTPVPRQRMSCPVPRQPAPAGVS